MHTQIAFKPSYPYREAIQKKAAQMEKERHEQGLRNLAQQARDERIGLRVAPTEVEAVG